MDCTFAGAGGYGDSNRLEKLSGKDLPGIEAGKTTRLVALEMIYRKIK